MSIFEAEFPPFRLANTHHGDTLQSIAGRELGDENLWPSLIWLNGLVHPYITDNPALVTNGVILSGSQLRVPAPFGFDDPGKEDNDAVYGVDCLMNNRQLVADEAGDFAIVSGVDNLRQQLSHRINTPTGQARRHPEYGCRIYRLVGTVNNSVAGRLGAEYVKSSLLADYRVNSVTSASAIVSGDAVRIEAVAEAVTGDSLNVART